MNPKDPQFSEDPFEDKNNIFHGLWLKGKARLAAERKPIDLTDSAQLREHMRHAHWHDGDYEIPDDWHEMHAMHAAHHKRFEDSFNSVTMDNNHFHDINPADFPDLQREIDKENGES